MDRFGGPPINRTARGGVDPIHLRLPPSMSLPLASLSLSRTHRSDLATALLPRPPVQPPAPANHVLAPLLCAVFLPRMRVKTLCHIRSNTVVWTSLGPLPWWVQRPTTRWALGTT
jgi:hypothetical protein